jgi:hypothetical protein
MLALAGGSMALKQQVVAVPGAVQQLVVLLSSSNQDVKDAAALALLDVSGDLGWQQQVLL